MKRVLLVLTLIFSLLTASSCDFSINLDNGKTEDSTKEETKMPSSENTQVPTETLEPTEQVTPTIPEGFTISFNTLGVTENITPINNQIVIPANLPNIDVEGYIFGGWYYDSSFTIIVEVGTDLTSDVTLYGKYTQINSGLEFDDTNKISSNSKTCSHVFVDDECITCFTEYDSQIFNIFKSNTIIYDNDTTNPYHIDLDVYGSDIKAVFYEPDTRRDIYTDVTSTTFYSNYSIAATYEEAYFRTQHKFMSGDIADQDYLAPTGKVMTNGSAVRCTTSIYILDPQGNYIGYIPNNIDGENRVIWYGGAYISFNDVAAYLYAFGEVPANSNYDKGTSGRKQAIAAWGKYGRVNIGEFYANTSKYPFQPEMKRENSQKYTETDFGTQGGYRNVNTITGTSYSQSVYNNGSSISRGAARFCFVNNKKSVDLRYVFYTYNHYNDFQEYLNYDGGFGVRFGNQSAGNEYCSDASDYNASNQFPITQYQSVALRTYSELINLI